MKNPKHKLFVEKSVGAALSAIEIYNKPDFKYREETFSILMINAWELLLKARIIQENNGKLKSIYVFVNKTGIKGNTLKTKTPDLNRSKNPKTIGLPKCLGICEQAPINLDDAVKENIFLLMEIRDTAIHFQHSDKDVSKSANSQNTDYRAYIAIIPGTCLAKLYERYGARLLEQNVRSFLQFTGKINKGIRDTIRNEPYMFLAFNNGIAATADHIELDEENRYIKKISSLQFVNGGQTTASMFFIEGGMGQTF